MALRLRPAVSTLYARSHSVFGLPSPGGERADALVLPLPVEKTVSYGVGTSSGPRAIIAATLQVETFDEERWSSSPSPRFCMSCRRYRPTATSKVCLARISDHVSLVARQVPPNSRRRAHRYLSSGRRIGRRSGGSDRWCRSTPTEALPTAGRPALVARQVMRRLWEQLPFDADGIRSMTRTNSKWPRPARRIVKFFRDCLENHGPKCSKRFAAWREKSI